MSSYYLGDKNARFADEKDQYSVGGPMTASYENYVRNIFRPGEVVGKVGDQPISAVKMLNMERHFGKDALDDSKDAQLTHDDGRPLHQMFADLGIGSGDERASYAKYPVYTPKQSSEYYSTLYNSRRNRATDDGKTINGQEDYESMLSSHNQPYSNYSTSTAASRRERADADWKKNNRQILVDYKDLKSVPLTPYMYQSHPYVQRNDTRIVGSNFVQITSRPRDAFLEKVDKTLAEVRNSPRYARL